jgi:hypothetical protein
MPEWTYGLDRKSGGLFAVVEASGSKFWMARGASGQTGFPNLGISLLHGSVHHNGTAWITDVGGAGSTVSVGGGVLKFAVTPASTAGAVVVPTTMAIIDSLGRMALNSATTSPFVQLYVKSSAVSTAGILIVGAPAQTNDQVVIEDSAATVLYRVTASGRLVLQQNSLGNTAPSVSAIDVRGTSSQIHVMNTDSIDGGYLTGLANVIYASSGVHYSGTAWIADSTAAGGILGVIGSQLVMYSTPATTVGASVTPVMRFQVNATGYGGFGGNSLTTQGLTVTLAAATHIGQVLKAAAAQTGDLQQWQNSSATVLAKVRYDGLLAAPSLTNTLDTGPSFGLTANSVALADRGINTGVLFSVTSGTQARTQVLGITAGNAATIPLAVIAAASQTGDLQQWQNSSATALASVTSAGDMRAAHFRPLPTNGYYLSANAGQYMLYESGSPGTALVAQNAAYIPFWIKGAAAQTGDLTQWVNSSSIVVASVGSAGAAAFAGLTLTDATNVVVGTTTGTKIGTATTQKLGFYNAAPVVQPSAYTQTYATADKTHATRLATAVASTAATQTSPFGYTTQAQADDIIVQLNNLQTDQLDTAQLLNSLIDDLQALGLVG